MKGLVNAAVGFAADSLGNGVAYLRIGEASSSCVLRVGFAMKRQPALLGREVGYAALLAASTALQTRGIRAVRLTLNDRRLVDDLLEHRDVPQALMLAYVRLRCSLNQFQPYRLAFRERETDLDARARSEVAFHAAA